MTAVEAAFFPLDEQLRLRAKHWSEGLLKEMVWLSGLETYGKAEEILARIGQVTLSDSSVWREAQRWGTGFQAVAEVERMRSNLVPGRWGTPLKQAEPQGRMGVAMDGGMVNIRGEGWKELKAGTVFRVEVGRIRDELTKDWIEAAHAVENSHVGHLGGPEKFGQMIWAEADRRGWGQAADTEVVGDGAPWIWNLAMDYFYAGWHVVDWYHAKEHLASVARTLKGDDTPAMKQWLNSRATVLFQGRASRIAQELETEAKDRPALARELQREAGYFHRNQRRMQYQELREDGWVIGSGMVESACKQFKARFTGPGMHWSRSGCERLIPVRAAIMSQRFDELWRRVYNSPPN
ncbi:MAG: ISKra4 family transposase [Anaerolineae bacterium]|nr:ISKra4 family transposase [Anaerolineae bacterium]